MVDIDHFKSINDTHGHSVGDDVLRDLGNLLLKLFGDESIVCRFGGEEFAILLMNANTEQAFAMAGQLRNRLVADKIGGLNVTASIGVSIGSLVPWILSTCSIKLTRAFTLQSETDVTVLFGLITLIQLTNRNRNQEVILIRS